MAAGSPAGAFDAWYEGRLGSAADAIELALVAELAESRAGERALDVGCGTVIYTAWLLACGLEATGIDRDPAMLAGAERRGAGARLPRADVAALPLARTSSISQLPSRCSRSWTMAGASGLAQSWCEQYAPAGGS